MTICAYDEAYLESAQRTLGEAVDFAVLTLGLEPDTFAAAFCVSAYSKRFGKGEPALIVGMTGCELARRILDSVRMAYPNGPDTLYQDKSPEYWAGWALAFAQWQTAESFSAILQALPLSKIIEMYPTFHEMDVLHFSDFVSKELARVHPHTRLREKRENCGLSQAGLAAASGVSLRQIQLFEQRQRDINKTSAATLLRLSKVLSCRMEDLLEWSSL